MKIDELERDDIVQAMENAGYCDTNDDIRSTRFLSMSEMWPDRARYEITFDSMEHEGTETGVLYVREVDGEFHADF